MPIQYRPDYNRTEILITKYIIENDSLTELNNYNEKIHKYYKIEKIEKPKDNDNPTFKL